MRSTSDGDHNGSSVDAIRLRVVWRSSSSVQPTSITVICWLESAARAKAAPAAPGPEPIISAVGIAGATPSRAAGQHGITAANQAGDTEIPGTHRYGVCHE